MSRFPGHGTQHSPLARLIGSTAALGVALMGLVAAAPAAAADPMGSISGTVTVPAGYFAADVTVRAWADGGAYGAAEVAEDGSYAITDLAPGDYDVFFEASAPELLSEWWENSFEERTPVTVAGGADTGEINSDLVEGGSISGTVTVPDGYYATDVIVEVVADIDNGQVRVAADGTYAVVGLYAGEYTVIFRPDAGELLEEYWPNAYLYVDATPVTVTLGTEEAGINADLELGGSISGHITLPEDYPAWGVSVGAQSDDGWGAPGEVGDDGTYSIVGLIPGEYTVGFGGNGWALLDKYWPGAYRRMDAMPVTVALGQNIGGIDETMVYGGSISGTVTVPDGYLATYAWVYVWSDGDVFTGDVQDDGSYMIDHILPPGDYQVEFWSEEDGLTTNEWEDVFWGGPFTPVVVEPDALVTGIDTTLVETGSISGTVTVPDGHDITQVTASALPVDRNFDTGGYSTVAADGTYSMGSLAPGDYWVSFGDQELGYEYWEDASEQSAATLVTVTEGSDTGSIDPILGAVETGATITGTVTGPDGPVAGVLVTAWPMVDYDGIWDVTGPDGTYELTGLSARDWVVEFDGSAVGLVNEWYGDTNIPEESTIITVIGSETISGVDATLALDTTPLFTDVPASSPFFTEIGWLARSGITRGYPDGTFHPSAAVERQAMAAFLYRFAGEPEFTPPATPSFTDVPASHPFFLEIEWLASTGITTGWPDRTFRPSANVERQAMAAFLYRFADSPDFTAPGTASFVDVPTNAPFFREVEWLASTAITTGWPDHTFRPSANVERQAMAAFLMRFDALGAA